jgi:regulator of RNase E activity RraA
MRVSSIGEPVILGRVEIATGDLVLADDDGVVVVPRKIEDRVLELARARVAAETTVLHELLAGETLRAVWDRHHVL